VTYAPNDDVRMVTQHGSIQWRQHRYFVSRGLVGQPVAIRPLADAEGWEIVFCQQQVARIPSEPEG
jgi:hypothetical protein